MSRKLHRIVFIGQDKGEKKQSRGVSFNRFLHSIALRIKFAPNDKSIYIIKVVMVAITSESASPDRIIRILRW
jgi:hypothetical protein